MDTGLLIVRFNLSLPYLAYNLRWKAAHDSKLCNTTDTAEGGAKAPTNTKETPSCTLTTENPNIPLSSNMPPIPFEGHRKAPPRTNKELEKSIKELHEDLEKLVRTVQIPKPNLSKEEHQAIRNLSKDPTLTIIRSDKGGEMVVMKHETLHQLTMDHLGDSTTYKRLSRDPTETLRKKINSELQEILLNRGYPLSFARRLMTSEFTTTQRFYSLPKTHKATLKIRPIVSGHNGIFDRLGWLLQNILNPLLSKVSAHVSNTNALIERFKHSPRSLLEGKIPISFDVVSLYTNIGVLEAIDTALQYASRHNLELYGLELADIKTLLHFMLNNNTFVYNCSYYQQIRGLAMGNRLSGTLAILVKDKFEHNYIYNTIQPASQVYIRYVDDSNTIANDEIQAQEMLVYLNKQHPTIKFELALPESDRFLPILDIEMKITADGSVPLKHYQKPASRGITLHFDSHHPATTKRAIANNELERAIQHSTGDNRQESMEEITSKLRSNGYPQRWLQHRHKKTEKNNKKSYNAVLKIPYISDTFNARIHSCLKSHGFDSVRLVNPRPQTIEQLASRKSPQPPHCRLRNCPIKSTCYQCSKSHVVYLAECQLCNATYVGSTTRALHTRAREHLYAVNRKDPSSALGEHYQLHHPKSTTSITFRILANSNKSELRLPIMEAMIIQQVNPTLNRKTEHLGLGFLI